MKDNMNTKNTTTYDFNDADTGFSVDYLTNFCHSASFNAGWWKHNATGIDLKAVVNNPTGDLEKLIGGLLVSNKLCLIHSEISEAMEGDRKDLMDDKIPHRKAVEVELADALIRICDLAGAMNLDLAGAVVEKMAFNSIRPDHKTEARESTNGKKY